VYQTTDCRAEAAMGLAQDVAVLYVAYVVFGVAIMVPTIILDTLLQRIVPADTRGRVFSTIGAVAG
jgi:hypothetical protein